MWERLQEEGGADEELDALSRRRLLLLFCLRYERKLNERSGHELLRLQSACPALEVALFHELWRAAGDGLYWLRVRMPTPPTSMERRL